MALVDSGRLTKIIKMEDQFRPSDLVFRSVSFTSSRGSGLVGYPELASHVGVSQSVSLCLWSDAKMQ